MKYIITENFFCQHMKGIAADTTYEHDKWPAWHHIWSSLAWLIPCHLLHITRSTALPHNHTDVIDDTLWHTKETSVWQRLGSEIKELVFEFDYWYFILMKTC